MRREGWESQGAEEKRAGQDEKKQERVWKRGGLRRSKGRQNGRGGARTQGGRWRKEVLGGGIDLSDQTQVPGSVAQRSGDQRSWRYDWES